jgi:hypothetical protein
LCLMWFLRHVTIISVSPVDFNDSTFVLLWQRKKEAHFNVPPSQR